MDRPTLNKDISLHDFKDFYWLKQELVGFCKTIGISPIGGKINIASQIQEFLSTGRVSKVKTFRNKNKSTFDWANEKVTLQTVITDNYKNSENVRRFFIEEIGSHFSFNVIFMKWIKDNIGKNLGDAIEEWQKIYDLKRNKNYISEIKPQFEYNRYMRAFLNDNPSLSSKDAMKYWKLKKAIRGKNEYEKTDLELK